MLYRREGFPQEDELVLATVTKIFHSTVFANLDEYDRSGLIHISEVSPGRIRNLREHVTVGKKVVCKVLRVDKVKGHIDLSIRRVNMKDRQNKLEEIKQEQKAEKTVELVAIKNKVSLKKLYDQITDVVFEKYSHIFSFFKDVAEGRASIKELKLDKKLSDVLNELVMERFVPAKVEIKGVFSLKSFEPNGVEVVKKALSGLSKLGNVAVIYLGGGRYKVVVSAEDYKEGESVLKKVEGHVISFFENGEAVFVREK